MSLTKPHNDKIALSSEHVSLMTNAEMAPYTLYRIRRRLFKKNDPILFPTYIIRINSLYYLDRRKLPKISQET